MAQEMDLSSFMAVLIMTIGCLVILLVTNVVVIISNPENLSITTLMPRAYESADNPELASQLGEPFFANKSKEPSYIDVNPDKLVIYPGGKIVPVQQLELAENPFEQLLDTISRNKEKEYVILIVRPGSSKLTRRLRAAIADRNIDVGWEFFENDRRINYIKAGDKDKELPKPENGERSADG